MKFSKLLTISLLSLLLGSSLILIHPSEVPLFTNDIENSSNLIDSIDLTNSHQMSDIDKDTILEDPLEDNLVDRKNTEEFRQGHLPISIDQQTVTPWDTILDQTGLTWLHDNGYYGDNVRIGIIDNGVDKLHPGLSVKSITENSFDDSGSSTQTHGTPVAGVILGSDPDDLIGAAPNASIYSAEMGSNPADSVIFGNFTEATQWLVDNNVTIINTSFGGFYNWTDMIEIAKAAGVIIVGSAGNDGVLRPVSGPGADPYAISVGAMASFGSTLAMYTSKGPTTDYLNKPDLVAFGSIESTNVISGSNAYVGTSFAAPLISGGIASLISALNVNGINWTAGSIKAALMSSARTVSGSIAAQGKGLVNFTEAFEILNGTIPSIQMVGYPMLDEFEQLYTDLETKLPIQVIIDFPDLYTHSLSGNLSDILELAAISQSFTPFTFNSNSQLAGVYTGYYTISNGSTLFNQSLTFTVSSDLRGIVGVDYYHNDLFITGEENLLNTFNSWAQTMRDKGYWLESILNPFDTIDLFRYDSLMMTHLFRLQDSIAEEFSSVSLSASELLALENFYDANGQVFLSFDGTYINSNDLEPQINEVLAIFGQSIDENNYSIKSATFSNRSNYGRNQQSISMEGYELIGGNSMLVQANWITYSRLNNPAIISGTDQLWNSFDNSIFNDILGWINIDNKFEVSSNFNNSLISTSISPTVSNLNVLHNIYNYDQSINESLSFSFTDVFSLNHVIFSGLHEFIYSDNDFYFRQSYREINELIIDNTSPVITFLGTEDDLVVNVTAGETNTTLYFSLADNYEINPQSISLLLDNVTYGSYLYDESEDTLQVTIPASLVKLASIFNISVSDQVGNTADIYVDLIKIVPPTPITERTTRTISIDTTSQVINYDPSTSQLENFVKNLVIFVVIGSLVVVNNTKKRS